MARTMTHRHGRMDNGTKGKVHEGLNINREKLEVDTKKSLSSFLSSNEVRVNDTIKIATGMILTAVLHLSLKMHTTSKSTINHNTRIF